LRPPARTIQIENKFVSVVRAGNWEIEESLKMTTAGRNWEIAELGDWEIDGSPKMTTTEPNWEIVKLGNWEIEGSLKMKQRSLRSLHIN